MVHRLSASKKYLTENCLYWLRDEIEWIDTAGMPAKLGTAVHQMTEDFICNGTTNEYVTYVELHGLDNEAANRLPLMFNNWKDWWQSQDHAGWDWAVEMKMAYDPMKDHTVKLNSTKHRDYSEADPYWETCTADLVQTKVIDNNKKVVVTDWKTGYKQIDADCGQMQIACLMASRLFDVTEVTSRIVQISDDGPPIIREHTFSEYDLAGFAAKSSRVIKRRFNISAEVPNPGSHCTYCPAKLTCPETLGNVNRVLVEVTKEDPKEMPVGLDISDNNHAKWALVLSSILKDYAELLQSRVKAWADKNGGVSCDDGTSYQKIVKQKDVINLTPESISIIEKYLGDKANNALVTKVTKAAIERSTDKNTFKLVLDELRKTGYLTKSYYETYDYKK